MQSDSRSHEPRLATLFTLVGGILCLTGVAVASYLAEDAARAPRPASACAESERAGGDCAGVVPAAARCGELTELAAPRGKAPMARIKVG
jgi:hypothetical protein